MSVKVECYAGYRGEQEPRAFHLGARRLEVREIVDRWAEPQQRWFKCLADDDCAYVLRHDESAGSWELVGFTHVKRSRG